MIERSAQTFSAQRFEERFGSWTSSPKIVDVRPKRSVCAPVMGRNFLTPGIRAEGSGRPRENPTQEV